MRMNLLSQNTTMESAVLSPGEDLKGRLKVIYRLSYSNVVLCYPHGANKPRVTGNIGYVLAGLLVAVVLVTGLSIITAIVLSIRGSVAWSMPKRKGPQILLSIV